MLFLHLKVADAPIDFGVRAYQHDKARSLRRALDAVTSPQRANFIVAGDFNPVGLELTFSPRDIDPAEEIARLRAMYGFHRDRMRLVPKSHAVTFWNGPGASDPPVDLDHVVAADHVSFGADANGAEIRVRGWPELASDTEQGDWIRDYSDHACQLFEVAGTP